MTAETRIALTLLDREVIAVCGDGPDEWVSLGCVIATLDRRNADDVTDAALSLVERGLLHCQQTAGSEHVYFECNLRAIAEAERDGRHVDTADVGAVMALFDIEFDDRAVIAGGVAGQVAP